MSNLLWPTRRRRTVGIVCAALWLAALVATHLPPQDVPNIHASDKVLHGIGFFVLGCMFWLVLRARGSGGALRVLGTLAVLMLYAGFDEITQPLFDRSAEWGDWNTDCLGATLAIIVCELVLKLRSRGKPV